MSVKYYHVLAFSSSTESVNNQTSYLGKTSDLVMKPEPDKTIDLDDGTTETGSEKLTVSFSMLGKLQNPTKIRMIWLVPICSDYSAGAQIIKLKLDSEDYRIENKSGEFEKILFNATLRYPTDINPWPYEYDGEYFANYFMIIGRVSDQYLGSPGVEVRDSNEDVITSTVLDDNIVAGYYAFVLLPEGTDVSLLASETVLASIDGGSSIGVVRIDIEQVEE